MRKAGSFEIVNRDQTHIRFELLPRAKKVTIVLHQDARSGNFGA